MAVFCRNWVVTAPPVWLTVGVFDFLIQTREVARVFYFYFLLALMFGGVGVLYLFGKSIVKAEQ